MSRLRFFVANLAVALVALVNLGRVNAQPPKPIPTEAELLAVLRSDASEADKALTCKRLAVYGSPAAVADLAGLLANERLASWARIALEAIPGPEADSALRKAAETLERRLLVGVINSLGVRGDVAAIPLLAKKLSAVDTEVAAAAAAALGNIGTPAAATPLAGALAAAPTAVARDAVAQACVVVAEKLRGTGHAAEATAVLEAVRRADVSEQRQAEAIRGLILTGGIDGVPLLVETLRSPVRRVAKMGLFTARELGLGATPHAPTAAAVDLALVAELEAGATGDAAAVERAALVASVLADRAAGGARPEVTKALLAVAGRGPKSLRLTAITALGVTGDAGVLVPLLGIAADPDPGYAVAVREAVGALPRGEADAEIRRRLTAAAPAELPLLAAIAGDLRIPATAELVALADHPEETVRLAAIAALGPVVELASLEALLQRAVQPRSEAEGAAARKALLEASVRMSDRDACATKLVAATEGAPVEKQVMLLGIVSEVGGPRALAAVAAAGKSGVPELDDAATRLLGKWMTADAAPVLLELAGPQSPSKFRTRALRGYLRIARQFDLPVEERAAMCRKALGVAKEEVDRKAIIEILKRYPAPATNAVLAEAEPGVSFSKRTLTERFVAEGCAVTDFDHDGHVDITAGNLIWFGPDFARTVEFTPPADNPSGPSKTPYDPARGYSDFFLAFAHDFTGDGWADILVYGLPGTPALLFVNPAGQAASPAGGQTPGHWAKHAILPVADGESPDLRDITGDGRPELFVQSSGPELGGRLGFAEIDWNNPVGPARFRPITPRTPENDKKYFRYTHGSGAGDVNGDGRVDILTKEGWFEQPADISADVAWEFHPVAFGPANGPGGAQMEVYDVNGDGRNDVITSYDAHGYGLGWFEQRADGTFVEHRILGSTPGESPAGVAFSQLHALALADIDGDGLKDIVTGKRRWAHGPKGDAEPNAPPVLYWFRLVRDGKGGVAFEPHMIDDDSGVGTQVTVADLDGDGRPDIVVANKRGVFTFTQQGHPQ